MDDSRNIKKKGGSRYFMQVKNVTRPIVYLFLTKEFTELKRGFMGLNKKSRDLFYLFL